MEVEQAGIWARAHGVALVGLGLGPGVVGREAGGATNGLVLPFQFLIEEGLSRGIGGDPLEKKESDQTLLEGAKATFDLPLGLGLGATRWEMPKAVRARWNSDRGSSPSVEDW